LQQGAHTFLANVTLCLLQHYWTSRSELVLARTKLVSRALDERVQWLIVHRAREHELCAASPDELFALLH
jgi:hypothetical protein